MQNMRQIFDFVLTHTAVGQFVFSTLAEAMRLLGGHLLRQVEEVLQSLDLRLLAQSVCASHSRFVQVGRIVQSPALSEKAEIKLGGVYREPKNDGFVIIPMPEFTRAASQPSTLH
jgi:hypothetical protein